MAPALVSMEKATFDSATRTRWKTFWKPSIESGKYPAAGRRSKRTIHLFQELFAFEIVRFHKSARPDLQRRILQSIEDLSSQPMSLGQPWVIKIVGGIVRHSKPLHQAPGA